MTVVLAVIGGLSGFVALIGFVTFYGLNKRKLKAETNIVELDFLTETIKTLKEENEWLRKRIREIEDEIIKMKKENGVLYQVNKVFKEAGKCRSMCDVKDCPIENRFKELGGVL